VLSPHGIRGELKCRVITDFPKQRFKRAARVYVAGQPMTVKSARFQGANVLLGLEEIPDRTTAEELGQAEITVPRHEALTLKKGQFYWHQVLGLAVQNAHTGEAYGTIKDILETGANDVYVVSGDRGEILVPAIKDVVKLIDPEQGRMLIEPLPGMIRE
jgi:16S rRNA processing protein RimM